MEPWPEMPTVLDAAGAIRSGRRSAVELTALCLERIEQRNAELNAFVHLAPEPALEAAAAVDDAVSRGDAERLGPLAGVPFGVKDLEDCAGMPTTRGSRWFAECGPVDHDDIHVGRLRAAGAIPLGKTASPEFGEWAYTASPLLGVTRNPWDPSRTPGGSSGGSSSAVAAAMVPFGTASDGGGSIRLPAAFTGLVGLRPVYGRIPSLGMTWLAQNAVYGSVTTTVSDSAFLLDVMAGPDPRDRTCLPPPAGSYLEAMSALDLSGLRVAFTPDLGFAVVDPEVAVIVERAARVLVAACGATLVDRDVALEDYIRIYGRVEGVDKFVGIPEVLYRDHLDELDPLAAPGWRSARGATLPKMARVEEARRVLVRQMAEVFDDVDLLVTPMTCRTAFAAEGPMPTEVSGVEGHGGMAVIHAMLASLVNLPAISVPAGVASDGLPVGMQVIGPRFREDLLLAAAHRYEEVHPWPRHAPRPS